MYKENFLIKSYFLKKLGETKHELDTLSYNNLKEEQPR